MPDTGAEPFLPYGRQSIDEADIAAVVDALRGDYLTTGPRVPAFEAAFAGAVGAAQAVVCNSGTAALHLCTLGLGLGPGDVAVVPAVTFLATANAVRYVGADVVFADVDPHTGLMTPDTLSAAIDRCGGRPIRAVLPVHLNGWVADLPAIAELAAGVGAAVVEDACHALGGTAHSATVGDCRHSRAANFSLHPVKTITMGEGGVVTTNDTALADRMRLFRNHGMTRDPAAFRIDAQARDADGSVNPWYYEQHELGFNYRATDFACALGQSQLARLPDFVARRRTLAARYDRMLAALAPRVRPVPARPNQQPGLHLYVVQVDFAGLGHSRGAVMRALAARGIGTQVHYLPVHRQPYYRALYGDAVLAGADHYYESCLSLPLYPDMAPTDVDRVVGALAAVLGLSNGPDPAAGEGGTPS